jgi:hypothetical protein
MQRKLGLGLFALLMVLGGDAMFIARANVAPPVQRHSPSEGMYFAQLGVQAQSACLSVCNKRCDADYKTCSMNGKAPQLLLNQTCSPRVSDCNNKCNASCVK